MNKLLYLLIFTSVFTYAQKTELHAYIPFKTEYERESWKNPDKDILALAMSIDSTFTKEEDQNFRSKLDRFYKTHSFTAKDGKKRIKNVQELYLAIHSDFLFRYRDRVDFSQLVRKGEYNCVTASILYAEILKHYQIPFVVLNEPQHVFLVAYPDEEYIVLQTTSPKFEEFQVAEKVRLARVNEMLSEKVITPLEVDTLGTNQAYEIYFNNQNRVTIAELLGYDYYNQMVYLMENQEDYSRATEMGIRANYLIPSSNDMAKVFFQTAILGLGVSGFNDPSALYLAMSNLGVQPKMNFSENSLSQVFIVSDIFLELFKLHPELNAVLIKMIGSGVNPFNVLSELDYYWDGLEDDQEMDQVEELDEALYAVMENYDLKGFERSVSELIKEDDWRKVVLIASYKLVIQMKMDMDLSAKYAADNLRELDPKNAYLNVIEKDLILTEFRAAMKTNGGDFTSAYSQLLTKASEKGVEPREFYYIGRVQFEQMVQDCMDHYYDRKLTLANSEFEKCLKMFKDLHKLEGLDEDELESLEYKMGNLFLKKSENFGATEERKIITEGYQLLPSHVVLKVRYNSYKR